MLRAMSIYGWLICALWLTLVAYWAVAANAARRSSGSRWIWWREIAVRLAFFALVVLALQVAVARAALPNEWLYPLNTRTPMGLIGLALSVPGIGLAILGRAYLTRSWRSAASNEQDAVLVTAGPYGFVRHPIYGGMLLAMLGSAFAQSVFWLLPLIVYGPQFIHSARREESLLLQQFTQRYAAYRQRTKMLLPFVL